MVVVSLTDKGMVLAPPTTITATTITTTEDEEGAGVVSVIALVAGGLTTVLEVATCPVLVAFSSCSSFQP